MFLYVLKKKKSEWGVKSTLISSVQSHRERQWDKREGNCLMPVEDLQMVSSSSSSLL